MTPGSLSFGLSQLACSYRVRTLEVYVENNGRWQRFLHIPRDEPIPAAGKRLDIARAIGRITQHLTQAVDGVGGALAGKVHSFHPLHLKTVSLDF